MLPASQTFTPADLAALETDAEAWRTGTLTERPTLTPWTPTAGGYRRDWRHADGRTTPAAVLCRYRSDWTADIYAPDGRGVAKILWPRTKDRDAKQNAEIALAEAA